TSANGSSYGLLGQGLHRQFEPTGCLLLAGDGDRLGNGAARAAVEYFPGARLWVPPAALMSVQRLVIKHGPTQSQKFDAARATLGGQFTAPGFQGPSVITLDLVRLEDATVLLGKADIGTHLHLLQAGKAVGTLIGQERQIGSDELFQHLDHA